MKRCLVESILLKEGKIGYPILFEIVSVEPQVILQMG
jgi:hypothetical protein